MNRKLSYTNEWFIFTGICFLISIAGIVLIVILSNTVKEKRNDIVKLAVERADAEIKKSEKDHAALNIEKLKYKPKVQKEQNDGLNDLRRRAEIEEQRNEENFSKDLLERVERDKQDLIAYRVAFNNKIFWNNIEPIVYGSLVAAIFGLYFLCFGILMKRVLGITSRWINESSKQTEKKSDSIKDKIEIYTDLPPQIAPPQIAPESPPPNPPPNPPNVSGMKIYS